MAIQEFECALRSKEITKLHLRVNNWLDEHRERYDILMYTAVTINAALTFRITVLYRVKSEGLVQ